MVNQISNGPRRINAKLNPLLHKWGLILTAFVWVFGSCAPKNESNNEHPDKKVITVSILPQKYVVEKIAGDLYTINVLVPPGSRPEAYEPAPGQIEQLSRSVVYLRIGHLGFEQAWAERMQEENPDMKLINLSEGIALIDGHTHEHDHGDGTSCGQGVDPHVWMSVKNMRIIADNTRKALIETDPTHEADLTANYAKFGQELDSLEQTLDSLLNKLTTKELFIFHPALAYLARDYGLTQIALEEDGKEPSAKHLARMVDIAREKNIRKILIQKEFDSENAITFAREIEAELVVIDPLSPDWDTELIKIARSIAQ